MRDGAHHHGRKRHKACLRSGTVLHPEPFSHQPREIIPAPRALPRCKRPKQRIDIEAGSIIFESLKKRRKGLYCAVPVPPAVIDALDLVHGLREARKGRDGGRGARLWGFSRTSAWRYVAAVLDQAGIKGPQASPKGLRHGFGVQAVSSSVPLNMVQKWLGHAQLSTTAIYADAVGAEEQSIMQRMWG